MILYATLISSAEGEYGAQAAGADFSANQCISQLRLILSFHHYHSRTARIPPHILLLYPLFSLPALMAPLSCITCAKILELHNPSSETPLSISQIACRTHTCCETVRRVLRRVRETGTLHYDMPRSGHPRILTPWDLDHLKLVLARGEAANATKAQHLAAPQVSARTVHRNLSEDGLYGRVRWKKPYLSALNVKQQRTWVQEVAGWGMDQWRLVVFSDESKFNLFGSDGR